MIINPPSGITQGSVIFVGAGGVYSEDNPNFFWDDTNNRLGLGTATPTRTLDIVGGLNQASGVFNLNGNGNSEIETSAGRLDMYAATGTAYDAIEEMSIGYLTSTGIAIGSTSTIGAIYWTYQGLNGLLYVSNMPNGATAIGHTFVSPSYTTAGAKIASFQNAYVEKAFFSKDGDVSGRRRFALGTALATSDFALSAGWGTTATKDTISGNDSHFTFKCTANGTGRAANPTITLTFKDGTFTTAPFAQVQMIDATNAIDLKDAIKWTTTATTLVITYVATPGAAASFTFTAIVIG